VYAYPSPFTFDQVKVEDPVLEHLTSFAKSHSMTIGKILPRRIYSSTIMYVVWPGFVQS
jgi:hypothetical protein